MPTTYACPAILPFLMTLPEPRRQALAARMTASPAEPNMTARLRLHYLTEATCALSFIAGCRAGKVRVVADAIDNLRQLCKAAWDAATPDQTDLLLTSAETAAGLFSAACALVDADEHDRLREYVIWHAHLIDADNPAATVDSETPLDYLPA